MTVSPHIIIPPRGVPASVLILPERDAPRGRFLAPMRRSEWEQPSERSRIFGPRNKTHFVLSGRDRDGVVRWRGLFEDREDADAFLCALVSGSLIYDRPLWDLPVPMWDPSFYEDLVYEFVSYDVIASGSTYTVKAAYGSVSTIEGLGGGQAGTSTSTKATAYPGGKGGYYCNITSAANIAAGNVLTVAIGAAGNPSAGAGGDTYLEDNTSTKIIVAPGGNSATAAVGTVKNAGGTGGGGSGTNSGGGGSAGAIAGPGNNGTNPTGGTSPGTLADGATVIGAGGNGAAVSANGSPGNQYGGAGGGAYTSSTEGETGGPGYQGVILFGYNPFVPIMFESPSTLLSRRYRAVGGSPS